MVLSYGGLFKLLADKGLSKGWLRETAHISPATLAKFGNGETVSLDILLRVCEVLNCDIGDLVAAVRR